MRAAVRNRLIIAAVLVVAAVLIGVEMYYSTTPPRHFDHDHAVANLDAGGFLRVETPDGKTRNLVGRPDKVLVIHWFDPTAADSTQPMQAADWAQRTADDVEFVLIARAPSRAGIDAWAEQHAVPADLIHIDVDGRTGDLFGVRRWPETLVYDPSGRLAYQAKGPTAWGPGMDAQVARARAGVDELH
jgi:hypothetical protein